MSRTFAIGDIHGCFDALLHLVDCLQLRDDDQLVFLGDYVNRGPDSLSVVRWLIQQSSVRPCAFLRGNHEIMLLEDHDDLTSVTAAADGSTWGANEQEFLQSLLPYHERSDYIFVHACVYGDMPMDQQPEYILHWEPFESMTRPQSGKKVVCGHTAQKSGVPLQNDFAVCIDTNCCRGGWLTALNVETGQYFQANQQRDHHQGWLDDWSTSNG